MASPADILSGSALHRDAQTGDTTHMGLRLGSALPLCLLQNYFGYNTMIMRKDTWLKLGGNDVINIKSPLVDWALYVKASLKGLKIDVIPEALHIYLTHTSGSIYYEATSNQTMLGYSERIFPSIQKYSGTVPFQYYSSPEMTPDLYSTLVTSFPGRGRRDCDPYDTDCTSGIIVLSPSTNGKRIRATWSISGEADCYEVQYAKKTKGEDWSSWMVLRACVTKKTTTLPAIKYTEIMRIRIRSILAEDTGSWVFARFIGTESVTGVDVSAVGNVATLVFDGPTQGYDCFNVFHRVQEASRVKNKPYTVETCVTDTSFVYNVKSNKVLDVSYLSFMRTPSNFL